MQSDESFEVDLALLQAGAALLVGSFESDGTLPQLTDSGMGNLAALVAAAPVILGQAQKLDSATAFAHMDPPSPSVAWIGELWNARLNQNLLHLETAPAARLVEQRVIEWLAPWFGMDGGHMTAGSTLANLTSLLAARELKGVSEVITSEASHISITRAAHLLGLKCRYIAVTRTGQMDDRALPESMEHAVLVLTAGTTVTGAIDPLRLAGRAGWTHVDAAWAGPLRMSDIHRTQLAGLENADSLAISAHKLMFQPKGSALVMFSNSAVAHQVLAARSGYLSTPNIGLLGSRPAAAVPLFLTLLAWGRNGLASRIERCLAIAGELADCIEAEPRLELLCRPQSGIVVWRPRHGDVDAFFGRLRPGVSSVATVKAQRWIRNVAANPMADAAAVFAEIQKALSK